MYSFNIHSSEHTFVKKYISTVKGQTAANCAIDTSLRTPVINSPLLTLKMSLDLGSACLFFFSKLALYVGFGYWMCMFYGETVELE